MLRPSVFFFPFNSAPKMPKARLISSRKETWKIILEDLISHSPKTNEQLEKPLKVWRYICPKKMTQLHQWNPQSIILTCRIWVSNTFWSSTSEISCHNTCRKCDIFWGKQMRLCVGQGWIGGLSLPRCCSATLRADTTIILTHLLHIIFLAYWLKNSALEPYS